jgi:cob(I)alamin adenosyltransferase
MQGQVQIYTGDGKGKTTAALGLAVRAAGAGLRVAFIQFDKGFDGEEYYSERKILRQIPQIELYATGKVRMMPNGQFRFTNSPPDFEEAQKGLELAKKIIKDGKHKLIVCDEILSCLLTGLLKQEEVMDLLRLFKEQKLDVELVLTGRSLPEEIKAQADLVTEMKMLKHYFNSGVPARKGIEF